MCNFTPVVPFLTEKKSAQTYQEENNSKMQHAILYQ